MRVNQVLQRLRQKWPPSEIIQNLIDTHSLSARQAHRYLQAAQRTSKPWPIPKTKAAFTVKLPVDLIAQVRRAAGRHNLSISDWIAQALAQGLKADPPNG